MTAAICVTTVSLYHSAMAAAARKTLATTSAFPHIMWGATSPGLCGLRPISFSNSTPVVLDQAAPMTPNTPPPTSQNRTFAPMLGTSTQANNPKAVSGIMTTGRCTARGCKGMSLNVTANQPATNHNRGRRLATGSSMPESHRARSAAPARCRARPARTVPSWCTGCVPSALRHWPPEW